MRDADEVERSLKNEVSELVTKQLQTIQSESFGSWEKELRLYVRPKPEWIPAFVWQRMVKAVLIQTDSGFKFRAK